MAVLAGAQWFRRQEGGVAAGDAPLRSRCNNVASATTSVVTVDDHGSALSLASTNVVQLDPERAVFDAMLLGWENQQRARFLKDSTIVGRTRLVRRFAAFSGLYPWQWTPAEGEAWISSLLSGSEPRRGSTLRSYEVELRMFCDYLCDPRYSWVKQCSERFGRVPEQVFHEDNSIVHVSDFEGDPTRRPLTYDEIQTLFDAADGRVDEIRARRRKGAATAMRDSALLKFCYAYGLRRREIAMCDVVDLRRNSKIPQFDRYGAVSVRHGKASRGGPRKRRTVLTVPEMSWVVDDLDHYLTEVRPQLSPGRDSALWLTERGTRISPRATSAAFATVRDAAGLDPSLDLHSLRHSYVTHLVEFDYPDRFIQEQVGHSFSSTTAIYVGVSNEYRNRLVSRAMHARYGEQLEEVSSE